MKLFDIIKRGLSSSFFVVIFKEKQMLKKIFAIIILVSGIAGLIVCSSTNISAVTFGYTISMHTLENFLFSFNNGIAVAVGVAILVFNK
jgi:hypothetical protein